MNRRRVGLDPAGAQPAQGALFGLGCPDPAPGPLPAPAAAVPAALPVPPPSPNWPAPPGADAYTGLAGELVGVLAPHSEADPVAILAQTLVAAGAAIGRGAHYRVEATAHHPNEYLLLVGESAKARKGSSWDHVARLLNTADPGFAARTSTGLSSGEGLIWALRDPAGADPGAADNRLLVIEPEFASVLKNLGRDTNTLSPVLRSAWDGRPLALLTRTAPAQAKAAHLAVIGHITAAELGPHTNGIETANGLLNRFLLIACRRWQLLPEGGHPNPLARSPLPAALAANLEGGRTRGPLQLDRGARALWWDIYPELSAPAPGTTGALCARSEAHTIRLALIYALVDGARRIHTQHLRSALALWDYAARSAAWTADHHSIGPLAQRIANALAAAGPDGLTRTQIRDTLGRNQPGVHIETALNTLAANHRARSRTDTTSGRPAQTWTAITPTESPTRKTESSPARQGRPEGTEGA